MLYVSSAPGEITGLTIDFSAIEGNDTHLELTITWTGPTLRNGPYNYRLNFTGTQSPPYPNERKREDDVRSMVVPGPSLEAFRSASYTTMDALPFALYTVTVSAYNLKRGEALFAGPSTTVVERSMAIGTYVCNLNFCTATCVHVHVSGFNFIGQILIAR